MTICNFCETAPSDGRLALAAGVAICRACADTAHDFFGATDKMSAADRPAALYPVETWDKRAPGSGGSTNPWDRRGH